MPERPCAHCGGTFTPRGAKARFCSGRCSELGRPKPTKSCVRCGGTFVARSNRAKYCEGCSPVGVDGRRHGRIPKGQVQIRCRQCHETKLVTAQVRETRFCSSTCWGAWQTRPFFGPPRPAPVALVHVGLTRRLLALERLGQAAATASGRLWVAGCCRRCEEPFVILDQVENAYCSIRCVRADGKDRRRAKQKAGAGRQRVYRRRIFERDGWRCQLCRRKVDRTKAVPHPLAPVLDHVVPLDAGGLHEPANVQLAHFQCNSEKGARVYGVGEQLRLVG